MNAASERAAAACIGEDQVAESGVFLFCEGTKLVRIQLESDNNPLSLAEVEIRSD